MPMSEEAFAGLRAVVAWNPEGARMLRAVLRERPGWVAYKDDPWGPLHLIQHADEPIWTTVDGRLVAEERAPFPVEEATSYARFGQEWLNRAFTKRELAEAIESVLAGRDAGEAEGIG